MKNPESIDLPRPQNEEEERIDCKVCEDMGQCSRCERGQLEIKRLLEANAGKPTKKGKFYAKRHWNFNPKEKK